ncbi:hypothetical protein Q5M85_03905 [Paraclostridium bifermentans]|nr:hypothetical protein [Paraclostridium bifermentans]
MKLRMKYYGNKVYMRGLINLTKLLSKELPILCGLRRHNKKLKDID